MTKQQKWIGMQIGLWAAYWCVEIFKYFILTGTYFSLYPPAIINLMTGTGFFYMLLLFAFPTQKGRINWLRIIFRIVLTALLWTAFRKGIYLLIAEWTDFTHPDFINNKIFIASSFNVLLKFGSYAGLVWFFLKRNKLQRHFFQKQLDEEQLSQELLIAEQAVLKAQINPHFLFNTLHFIHSRALLSGDKVLSDTVLLLSDILRYGLKDQTKGEAVPINEELAHIKKLQAINKLRFNGKHYLQITEEGEQHNHTIPPFVLLTFFENALKYGVWDEAEHPVTLSVVQTAEGATITLRNKIKPKEDIDERENFAIGKRYIENVLRGFYKKNFILDYKEDDTFHTVSLKLYEKDQVHHY